MNNLDLQNRKTFIILFITFLLSANNLLALNFAVSNGVGYQNEENKNDDRLLGLIGIEFNKPFNKYSSIGINYNYRVDSNYGYASNISVEYRNFFGKYPTFKNSKESFKPFIAILPSLLYLEHRDFIPGIELQVGFDILYKDWIIPPWSFISYPLTLISKSKQLLSISLWSSLYFKNKTKLFELGLKISTGTVF